MFALRRILAAAVADRRLTHNPAENVPLPVDDPGEQRYLTAEEVDLLAEVIEPRFRAMVLVAAYGGLRLGELTALRRQRVDVLRGRVLVAETLVQLGAELSFGPTKTRKAPKCRASTRIRGGVLTWASEPGAGTASGSRRARWRRPPAVLCRSASKWPGSTSQLTTGSPSAPRAIRQRRTVADYLGELVRRELRGQLLQLAAASPGVAFALNVLLHLVLLHLMLLHLLAPAALAHQQPRDRRSEPARSATSREPATSSC